jgi:hypothetical protein
MLYMGMEHLRTNNIPLAGHFLKSSRSMEKNDPLCCNELGVWAYRSREWKDGIRWFILALRLYVESVVSEKSALSWNEEDSKQDVSSKVNRPRFEFGQVLLSRIMIASNSVKMHSGSQLFSTLASVIAKLAGLRKLAFVFKSASLYVQRRPCPSLRWDLRDTLLAI